MAIRRKKRLDISQYVEGILQQDRVRLSQAITLVESTLEEDRSLARQLIERLLPYTGKAVRIGITGVPGVGKSTFIEALGQYIAQQGKKLAVLAVDPSSQRSRGSIMGDKTRMELLAANQNAYIRPSPAGTSLGGVASRTRETMLLCEAAGFEVIFIETVGVGQSETVVHGMVDFFLLLMLAGAGDELQGIKKGIMEMADVVAITKADGDNQQKAAVAKAEYQSAFHLFPPAANGWFPKVVTCSALHNEGIEHIWSLTNEYIEHTQQNKYFDERRKEQNLRWMYETIRQTLEEQFFHHKEVIKKLPQVAQQISEGTLPPLTGAQLLLDLAKK
ncbi:methylmalonyl Co-A mutase-associated GTPase MeaB [Microscilla marina]|uniref:LAO/AO transport system ATPase n=1 Tax=Microscilla marina ATCC 23134 TaxID=313606 RepID=A1ZM61_MICM2|nr:methylmalonyl Co-A mutase-associated GTPase MeaB [Microscilla marina]EAY28593.1 LAO/AO transport system ATPase [Microscilla marina ATCC 23134]